MMQNSSGVLSGTKTYFEGLKRVCVSYECFQQYLWHHNVHIQTLQLIYALWTSLCLFLVVCVDGRLPITY